MRARARVLPPFLYTADRVRTRSFSLPRDRDAFTRPSSTHSTALVHANGGYARYIYIYCATVVFYIIIYGREIVRRRRRITVIREREREKRASPALLLAAKPVPYHTHTPHPPPSTFTTHQQKNQLFIEYYFLYFLVYIFFLVYRFCICSGRGYDGRSGKRIGLTTTSVYPKIEIQKII